MVDVAYKQILALVTGVSFLLGQEAPLPSATAEAPKPLILKSTTRLVQVSVVATHKGEPVPDLKKEDFEITERGKSEPITLFSVESNGALPSSPVKLPPGVFTNSLEQRPGTPASVTIILLDNLNTHWADQSYARQQVIKFLQQIQPEDRIGLYVLGPGLRVLHDYTADSSLLLQKLAKYSGALPDVSVAEANAGLRPTDNPQLENWLAGGRGGATGAERDFYLVNRALGTLKSLEFIADHLASLPGRKNLIWVSGGFPQLIGFDNQASWRDPSREQRTFGDEITQTVRAMNNANLAVYPVDARGLMTDPRFSAERRTVNLREAPRAPIGSRNQDTMRELAERTGGKAFYNTNDLKSAIREAVADTRITYTIGYYPQDEKFDGKFHDIKVKVNRPGVSLRYRKGYFDLAEQPQDDKSRKRELRDAVFSPIDATEVPIAVMVKATDQPKTNSLLITMQIDPKGFKLQEQDGRWTGKVDVLFVQKDTQGRQFDGADDTIELRLLQANFEKVSKDGLLYRKIIDRNTRASELRVVVRDAASGSIGSVTIPFNQIAAEVK